MAFWKLPRHPWIGLALSAALGVAISDLASVPISLITIVFYFLTAIFLTLRPLTIGIYLIVAVSFFIEHQFQYFQNSARNLATALAQPQVISATGIVVSEPTVHENRRHTQLSNFELRLETIALQHQPPQRIHPRILVHWLGAPPAYGDRVSLIGTAQNLAPTPNPGQFDYTRYLQRRGIFSELQIRFADDERILAHEKGNPFIAISLTARRMMQRVLTRELEDSPDVASLVQSMVLGLKNETDEETLALFQHTGTMHLFVVNGLHIGMFAAIAIFLLKPLGVRRRALPLFIIPLLVFYAVVTGMSTGSLRATLMAGVFFLGRLTDGKALSLNNLTAAAVLLLAWDTNELFMPGFQFSFGVVLAILLLANPLRTVFQRPANPDPFLPRTLWSVRQRCAHAATRRLAALLAISTAAWIGSLVFVAHYFHFVSLTAILANVIIVPIAFLLLANGLASLTASLFSSSVSICFNNCNWAIAKLILLLIHALALIPNGHPYIEWPRLHHSPDCSVILFDFKRSVAFIRAQDRSWLIDCGSKSDYRRALKNFLQSRGVNHLDGLLLTHGDSTHISAEPDLYSDFKPRTIGASMLNDRSPIKRKIETDLRQQHVGLALYERNDRIRLSPLATLRVLYPPGDLVASAADDKALVLMLECENARILFMSDSGFLTEHWLLEHEPDLRADILVKGQHGSDISATPEFLAAVRPSLVISSAPDYTASESTLTEQHRTICAQHITPLRLDQTGAIEIAIANHELRVQTFLKGYIFRKSIR